MTCVSLYNIKQRSHPQHPTPDRLFPQHQTTIAPFTTHKPRSPIPSSTNDRPSPHIKPNRLFPQYQTAIAPSSPIKPDRLFPTPNSDRISLQISNSTIEILSGSILQKITSYIETWFNSIIQNFVVFEDY